jgi:hypothetical protein
MHSAFCEVPIAHDTTNDTHSTGTHQLTFFFFFFLPCHHLQRNNVCCMKCGRAVKVSEKEKHDQEFHAQVRTPVAWLVV